jgi:NTP pyrophosphatase (non-canonical NTP hydrolase)
VAALACRLSQAAANGADLELSLLCWNHEQHVIAGRLRTTAEVGEICDELAVKASRLFASSVQLDVKK